MSAGNMLEWKISERPSLASTSPVETMTDLPHQETDAITEVYF
jgi:hypothetical protein